MVLRVCIVSFLLTAAAVAGPPVAPLPPAVSPLVAAAAIYPAAQCCEGMRDPYLVTMAQGYAEQMAHIGSQSYRGRGHFGWTGRHAAILRVLGMDGDEITAESWPWEGDAPMSQIARGMFDAWRQSPGHWRIASRPHRRFGDGLAKSRRGIWYACIIVAN